MASVQFQFRGGAGQIMARDTTSQVDIGRQGTDSITTEHSTWQIGPGHSDSAFSPFKAGDHNEVPADIGEEGLVGTSVSIEVADGGQMCVRRQQASMRALVMVGPFHHSASGVFRARLRRRRRGQGHENERKRPNCLDQCDPHSGTPRKKASHLAIIHHTEVVSTGRPVDDLRLCFQCLINKPSCLFQSLKVIRDCRRASRDRNPTNSPGRKG